jgi:hypothetical protein
MFKEGKNLALLPQTISNEIKVLAEPTPEPPVEKGFVPSQESRQAAVSKANQTPLYKVLQCEELDPELDFGSAQRLADS